MFILPQEKTTHLC